MAERAHLAIGEVLTLLQGEFPDVTISKIRFLESQGLIDPERTPSGYRKFHDEDIARLRWILTQQRDHFLPLKVIKDRLVSGDLTTGPSDGVLPFADGATAPTEPDDSADDVAVTTDSVAPDDEPTDARAAARARAAAVSALVEGPAVAVPEPPAPAKPRGGRRHPTAHRKGDPTPDGADGADDPVERGSELDREALAAASGLSANEVVELERYGLLTARVVGGVESFDDDALAIARLAAGFARYGIEPRHLRMYKVAAEREADMFQQLITPLLRQRRAEARDRAVEMLEDLAEMADDLRAIMVQATLRAHLGGA